MSTAAENQQLVMHNDLVGAIHDRLLDDNNLDLAHAFNAAVCEIAALYLELERLERSASSGMIRKKPS